MERIFTPMSPQRQEKAGSKNLISLHSFMKRCILITAKYQMLRQKDDKIYDAVESHDRKHSEKIDRERENLIINISMGSGNNQYFSSYNCWTILQIVVLTWEKIIINFQYLL